MKRLWAYIRRKVMQSILAGVHDALASKGSAEVSEEAAATALQALIGSTDVPKEAEVASAPSLFPEIGNGVPPSPEPPKRGPGRPRKFLQEPPA
jgi:hypothetical protein